MKKLAVLAMASLISVTANSSDWVLVFNNSSINSFVDADSISGSGQYRSAFSINQFHEYQHSEFGLHDAMITYSQFDCKSNPKKFKPLAMSLKDGDQTIIASENPKNDWKIIYPDSAGEKIANFICSYKK